MVINGQICSNNSPDPGADGRVAEQVGAAGVGDGPPDVLLVGHPGWPRHQPPLAAHLGEAGGRGEEEGNQHECGPAAVHDDDDSDGDTHSGSSCCQDRVSIGQRASGHWTLGLCSLQSLHCYLLP